MAEGLDAVGRIVDFGQVKREVGGWLDKYLDHAFIAQRGDAIGELIEKAGLPVHWMVVPPTAENLAGYVFGVAYDLLAPFHIEVVKLRCWETPNCWAEFERQVQPFPQAPPAPPKKATW
jgi:6-pyruvoyl-tetrahydropterin synthase